MELKEYQLMHTQENAHWWFVAKRNYAKTILHLFKFLPKAKILDIGCGTGRNLQMLSQYGDVYGADYADLAIKFCKKRGFKNLKQASAEKLPFSKNIFNLVTFFDVLYHKGVKNDLKALKEAYRVLKPGGGLLITDCAHQWLYGPHDVNMHARQRYSKKELVNKVSQVGFKVNKASYIYFLTFPLFIVSRLLNKFIFKKSVSDVDQTNNLINNLLIFILKIESKFLKYISLPTGSSIIILAQK